MGKAGEGLAGLLLSTGNWEAGVPPKGRGAWSQVLCRSSYQGGGLPFLGPQFTALTKLALEFEGEGQGGAGTHPMVSSCSPPSLGG